MGNRLLDSGASSPPEFQTVLAQRSAKGQAVSKTTRWAFHPPVRPVLPKVKAAGWVRNPIDAFVLARLESKGLHPAPPADRLTLLRRVTFDVIGLPPTPEEVQAFLSDKRPDAYERVVDRLLASPHYGERWARHWLDLARYAESEGFKSDEMRPNAWRYRDYVIQALNNDKPYDRFVMEQLAGDELYPESPEALIATGFCRHWADESNARNLRERRQEILNDITDTTGATLLGLTVGCARCHDHKFDPISQKDYYRLQAFFAAVRPRDDLVALPPDLRAEWERKQRAWEQKTEAVRTELAALESPIRHSLYQDRYRKFPPDVQEAIDTAAEKRTPLQWLLFRKAEPQLEVTDSEVAGAMNGAKAAIKTRWAELRKSLDAYAPLKPGLQPLALGITDIGREAPKTLTLAVGVYDKPMDEVAPGFPSALSSAPPQITPGPDTTGRRSALARWIADARNPLTARVIVNRLWQYHFGRGLVGTSSDFGAAGEPPTHPELLDWLASIFTAPSGTSTGWAADGSSRRKRGGSGADRADAGRSSGDRSPFACGWSLKKLHRLILTSATYCQSAAYSPAAAKIDPEDTLLWRFRRQRLEGEILRDAMLRVSGALNPKMGGPSVMAELPSGVTARGYWKETADMAERNRRSVYLFVKRNLRYPLFQAFDFPDTHEPCARRQVTTTAPQALLLLNDDTALRLAQSFAGRVYAEAGKDPGKQIACAYALAFGRPPHTEETEAALAFLKQQAQLISGRAGKPQQVLLPVPLPADTEAASAAALVDFCHALFNSNEFLYIE